MPILDELDTGGEVVVILSVCQLLGLMRVQAFAIITAQKGFNISEYGEKPWRTRRCDRGLKSAKTPNERGHCQGYPDGKAADGGRIREPEDLLKPSIVCRNLTVKGSGSSYKMCQSPFLFGLVDT